ncbi:transglutaminase domain-containing protein [Ruminococcus flavefaciens]|uniref:Transglutaminase-like domain-containing protein n=1 Tax=Ruminococcus flavefaciens 007c TaxID=1341157 RepID=W7UE17_RUMFL|nr:transglutaminase domain-containing protein [Ruminococcus flavefaciens]EWM53381.1 hypothetical protein RF007C_10470 [Ruminococcus flavefaciens 007c]
MRKKVTAVILAAVCLVFLLIAGKYIKDSGILKGYPNEEFLSYDEEAIRPVYSELSFDEQAVYTALYRGISKRQEHIPLPFEVKGDDYSKVYCILEKQESGFFYLDSVYYTAEKVREARIVYRKLGDIDQRKKDLDEAVRAAVHDAQDYKGDDYKVRYINDFLVKKCRYITGDDSEMASTAYGCLVEGEANCEGYAKAFRLLASEMGVESVVVTGKTDKGENHAWNQVRIGTEWYNIDVTWADTDKAGEIRNAYFLCSDKDFSKTHFADTELFTPYKCGSDTMNYYVRSGLYAKTCEEAADILRRELSSGRKTVEIRFDNRDAYNEFMETYINGQKVFDVVSETDYQHNGEVTLHLDDNASELCLTLRFE